MSIHTIVDVDSDGSTLMEISRVFNTCRRGSTSISSGKTRFCRLVGSLSARHWVGVARFGSSTQKQLPSAEMLCAAYLDSCPHFPQSVDQAMAAADRLAALPQQEIRCHDCEESLENWLCLHCGFVGCSRYIRSHMSRHHEEHPEHCVVVSFADCSCHCYACDSYIRNTQVLNVVSRIAARFQDASSAVPEDQELAKPDDGAVASTSGKPAEDQDRDGRETSAGLAVEQDLAGQLAATSIKAADSLEGSSAASQATSSLCPQLRLFLEKLRQGEYKNIVVLSGAGISTAAGIPDFRSADGLYARLSSHPDLSHPTDIFSIEYFRKNPFAFYELAVELWDPGKFRPTRAHFFIRLLEEKGLLLRNFTQNIDGLEATAGLSSERLVQAHGGFEKCHCVDCGAESNTEEFRACLLATNGRDARCRRCGGWIKPAITFFGEALPGRFFQTLRSDMAACDALIIMGTSLQVAPVSMLPSMVRATVPRVVFNMTSLRHVLSASEGPSFASWLQSVLSGTGGSDDDDSGRIIEELRDIEAAMDDVLIYLGWEAELARMQADTASSRLSQETTQHLQ